MKAYEEMSRDELLDVVYKFSVYSTKQRAHEVLKGQIDGMLDYLEANRLVTKTSMADKDDKTWDRGRWIVDNINVLSDKLESLENSLTGAISKYVKDAEEGTAEDYYKKFGDK